jgi:hypothetical protein
VLIDGRERTDDMMTDAAILTELRRHAGAGTDGLGRYFADQAAILERLQARLAAPAAEDDPLEVLDRRIASHELRLLEEALRDEMARASSRQPHRLWGRAYPSGKRRDRATAKASQGKAHEQR